MDAGTDASPRERLRRLLEPVHASAVAFARHLCRSREDGDDLYQEAVLRALTKLDGLRDDAAFRAWLYRIVISVHRNRCRSAFWRRMLPFGERAEEAAGRGGADASGSYRASDWSPAAAEATGRARAALAALAAVQREAIVLFEIEGWTVEEIAGLYGLSVSAIKSRLARGREALRGHYERKRVGAMPVQVQGESP
jgi:RNA polymerase sigma-70 factor (ECF subfamily)